MDDIQTDKPPRAVPIEPPPDAQEPKEPKRRGRPPGSANIGKLEDQLSSFIANFSLPFAAAGDMHCATIIANGAPSLAHSWAEVAKTSPQVRKTLQRMMQGGAWSGVVVSTLAIAIPVADHHGLYPKRWPNPMAAMMPTPETPGENGQPPEATL